MFNDYDVVELSENLNPELQAGIHGVIVMIYPSSPQEYEVEFVNEQGDTVAISTVKEHQIRKVK